MNVKVDGTTLNYLESFANAFLEEFNNQREKLSTNDKKKIQFGSVYYKIQLQYGIDHGFAMHFFPNPMKNEFEYLIRENLNLFLNNQKVDVTGDGSIRIRYPDGSFLIYFQVNQHEDLRLNLARKKAREYFRSDCKEFKVKIHRS